MVLAVLFLNLAGGDCVEDLERSEADNGFAAILKAVERALLTRRERRSLPARWRRPRARAVPSPSAMLGWLERFHDPAAAKAVAGSAFIPAVTAAVRGLWQVNQALVGFVQANAPSMMATLDMDATLIETHKRDALHCYKGFKAYQPLNCWWAEQGVMLYSEFRDGNVPAGHEQLRGAVNGCQNPRKDGGEFGKSVSESSALTEPDGGPIFQCPIEFCFGCCCACGFVGNALALSTYPQAPRSRMQDVEGAAERQPKSGQGADARGWSTEYCRSCQRQRARHEGHTVPRVLIKRLAGCFYVPAAALRFLSVGGVIEARSHCAGTCAQQARCGRQREARRRYQATPRGRAMHADRNRRYRARQHGVTDHSPSKKREPGLLPGVGVHAAVSEPSSGKGPPRDWSCHHCGQSASPFLRLLTLRPPRCRGKASRSNRFGRPP